MSEGTGSGWTGLLLFWVWLGRVSSNWEIKFSNSKMKVTMTIKMTIKKTQKPRTDCMQKCGSSSKRIHVDSSLWLSWPLSSWYPTCNLWLAHQDITSGMFHSYWQFIWSYVLSNWQLNASMHNSGLSWSDLDYWWSYVIDFTSSVTLTVTLQSSASREEWHLYSEQSLL